MNNLKSVPWFAMMILLPNIAVNAFGGDDGVRYRHTLTAGVAAYMDVWTTTAGGRFMVFSSVVDNSTGDGTVVQPQW